jgi:uncharacterized membrane protein YesL
MKFFDIDGPLMQGLTKVADLMILNFLTILCCIPVVTAGAAFTALHYQVLRMVRNEDTYVARGFFKSFKENFWQATIIWILILISVVFIVFDYLVIGFSEEGGIAYWYGVVLGAFSIFIAFTVTMIFPILAKFSNTVIRTIKNAMAISVLKFPQTILMIIMYVLPLVIGYFFFPLIPLVLMFGISAPAFGSAKLYNKFFKKLEEQILETQRANGLLADEEPDPDRIFKDELDEGLMNRKN